MTHSHTPTMTKATGQQRPEDEELQQQVALFRYGLIADVAQLPRRTPGLYKKLEAKADKDYDIPGTHRRRVAAETLRGWLRAYRRGGFDALRPKERSDIGSARNIPSHVVDLLCETKENKPDHSVKQVIKAVRRAHPHHAPSELALPVSTVHRLLARRGLMKRGDDPNSRKDRRRFAYEDAGDLWMSDVMHGPRVWVGDRKRKAYLIAFLDDATRLVPHAEFALSEGTAAFLPVFEQALRKRGVPKRLYVDNGSAYRSHQLRLACAKLGIVLIHARPYSPEGKGKIERWFRTVRLQLMPVLEASDLASLEALNRRLAGWVEGEYHHAPHRGIDRQTPSDRWAQNAGGVRMAPADVAQNFLLDARRKVARDRTVTLDGVLFEVDAALIGETVILRYDPSRAPRARSVEVVHNAASVQTAKPLDAFANCFVKRSSSRARTEVEGDAPEVPPGLSMRDLDDDEVA